MKERIIGAVMIVVILIGFASYSGTFAWINASVDENALTADLTVGRMFSIEGELGSRYSMGEKKIMVPGENLIVRELEEGETVATTTAPAGSEPPATEPVTEDNYEPCKLSIKNDSTIETQLRVKIEYSYLEYNDNNGQVETIGLNPLCVYGNTDTQRPTDPSHRLQVQFSHYSTDSEDPDYNKWVYNADDGFWYYNPSQAESGEDDYLIIPADYSAIDLIDYIRYDPDYYTDSRFNYSNIWAGQEVQVRLTVQAKQARYVDWGTLASQVAEFGA